MRKFIYLLLLVLTPFLASQAKAQVVTTTPTDLQQDSQNVEIFFHADQGNKTLAGTPQSSPLYADVKAEVLDANGNASWKNLNTWGSNLEKLALSYVSPNLWKLHIGNILEFLGFGNDVTAVTKLAFRFRNADCSKYAENADGSDVIVNVSDGGFQITSWRQSTSSDVLIGEKDINFTCQTNKACKISIFINGVLASSADNVSKLVYKNSFNTPGTYTMTCRAETSDIKLGSDPIIINYTGKSQPKADSTIPPLGVTKNPNGSYTFCFAAPGIETMCVRGSWNDWKFDPEQLCQYVDRDIDGSKFRYFITTIPAGKISGPFCYYFSTSTNGWGLNKHVGDPYARLILDPYNDKYISDTVYPDMPQYPTGKVPNNTVLGYYADNLLDYNWQVTDFKRPDKTNLVIYELLFRDFTGTEGAAKADGTVRKAIEKIPYLKSLGVNVIELLPINEFNGNISWGYNPNFYFAVDKAYGTPQDYKEFIDKCHEAGMAVVLDVVFNQSDGLHPWYQLYDIKQNPFYNENAPHSYNVLNDWNQGYPLVEEQWRDMLQFWLKEYKVDGFRFDLVKGLGDNDSYRTSSESSTNAYNASRVARMKRLHAYMKEVTPDAYFINENLAGAKEENEMAADGQLNWANVNNASCQFAMGYPSDCNLNRFNARKDSRTAGSTVSYMESHDEERLAYKQNRWGVAGVKDNHSVSMKRIGAAAATMILCPGSHMIWMFSEMGNAQSTKQTSGGNNTDPKIVNWALLDDPDNAALVKSYSELIHIRLDPKNAPLFSSDITNFNNKCSITSTSLWNKGAYIYTSVGDQELYCCINPTVGSDITFEGVPFQENSNTAYTILSKSYQSAPEFNATQGTITVPANSYAVVTRNVSSAVKDIMASESSFSVSALTGRINVLGASGRTYIYSISGQYVGAIEEDGCLELPAGIYIVRNGAHAVKVMVR